MNTKQRDTVYQRWSSMIRQEARDLASLERLSARAFGDGVMELLAAGDFFGVVLNGLSLAIGVEIPFALVFFQPDFGFAPTASK